MIGYIYTLEDNTGSIFYVGATHTPVLREIAHRTIKKSNIPLYTFIVKNKIKCNLSILEEVEYTQKTEFVDSEKFWIEQMRQWGFPLQNIVHNRAIKRIYPDNGKPKKETVSSSLSKKSIDLIQIYARNDRRSFSKMLEILALEAIETREKKAIRR